jgi:UDP-2,3-diacylglucosamine pyrophosphatase LpxH
LSELWQDPGVQVLDTDGQKYAIISDLHMGNGGRADDFHINERALLNALKHYQAEGYGLILLGDIEEFWQFDLPHIAARYDGSVYKAMRAFGEERVMRLFGNHDFEWGGLEDPSTESRRRSALAVEALRLRTVGGDTRILLVHGHQGSIDSDRFSWFSRFFVRIFQGIEPIVRLTGLYGHRSATKSSVTKEYERVFYEWALKNRTVVICGHSHRAIFASESLYDKLLRKKSQLEAELTLESSPEARSETLLEIGRLEDQMDEEREKGRVIEPVERDGRPLPCYFNSGCGLYSDGITNLEIDGDEIRLVKWSQPRLIGDERQLFEKGSLSQMIARLDQ